MSIEIFDFYRKLKISRFTIDVLTERITQLKPVNSPAPGESARFVNQIHEKVTTCDQLHNELREQFQAIQSRDATAISILAARFEELHRKITESIKRLNWLEYGVAQ